MIEEPTLFITGAGASAPYGYPTGEGLKKDICLNFSKKYEVMITDAHSGASDFFDDKIEEAKSFTYNFLKSDSTSIDQFLARRDKYSEIGKYAIVLYIMKAENESKFRYSMDDLDQDWYIYLSREMTINLNKPDDYKAYRNNKVTFITFNYDRSLEYFLYDCFVHNWFDNHNDFLQKAKLPDRKTDDWSQPLKLALEKKNYFMPFPFFHVYGKVMDIVGQNAKPYAFGFAHKDIKALTKNIRVIYERTDEELLEIKNQFLNHKRIFFLGFGYAKENLDVLGLPVLLTEDHMVYGTAYGYSDKKIDDLKRYFVSKANLDRKMSIRTFMEHNLHFEPITCKQLLEKYL